MADIKAVDFYGDAKKVFAKSEYDKGYKNGRADANADHNAECGDCVRQLTAADEARIRADERKKVIDKIRELKKHSGQTVFCTKEYCPYHEDVDCHDCMDVYYGIEVYVNDKMEITDIFRRRDTKPIEPTCEVFGYRSFKQRSYKFPITQQESKNYGKLKKIAYDKIAEYEARKAGIT